MDRLIIALVPEDPSVVMPKLPTFDRVCLLLIREALIREGGKHLEAARSVGISLRKLQYWIAGREELAAFRRKPRGKRVLQ